MKVITFSRFFPSTHPKAGQPTFFVEKIWAHLIVSGQYDIEDCEAFLAAYWADGFSVQKVCDLIEANELKIHTIRKGFRWKKGEQFSPRVWSGKPYQSPQIAFAPALTIGRLGIYKQTERTDSRPNTVELDELAHNDGLSTVDFLDWFGTKEFEGQIIYF